MDEMTETRRKGLWPIGPLPPEAVPGPLPMPPPTIPLWQGDPEDTVSFLDLIQAEPPPLEPDSVGGMPGIPSPFWGGTEPPSRFEPGPKDDWWTSEELIRELNSRPLYFNWPRPRGWIPSEPPIETPEDAAMWDRRVREDTKGDDAY